MSNIYLLPDYSSVMLSVLVIVSGIYWGAIFGMMNTIFIAIIVDGFVKTLCNVYGDGFLLKRKYLTFSFLFGRKVCIFAVENYLYII